MKNPFYGLSKHYTRTLALTSTLLTVSSANYAFDNQAFSQTLALEPFTKQFGDYNAKTKKYTLDSTWLSLFNSLLYITFSIGVFCGPWFQAKYGRRLTIRLMNIIPLISTTIILTSHNRWQLLAGRVIHYLYAGVELGCIPVYQAELVPRQVRGFAVGSYQMSYGFGNLLMNLIVKGTGTIKSNASWRIPFGLFYIIPVIVGTGSFFIPESPRWLIQVGRIDEARSVLRELRKTSDEEIEEEIEQVLLVLEAQKHKGSWADMLRGTNRRRTLICCGTIFFNQSTGQNFISQYGALFVKSLGTINAQTMGIVNACGALISTLAAMYATDKYGRRMIFITGACIQSVALWVMAGLGIDQQHVPAKSSQHNMIAAAITALVPIYGLGYGFGSSSVNHVISAEVPHQTLRDKTQRVVGILNNTTAFAVSFSLPYLLNAPYANLGPKVGFIFGPFALLSIIWGLLAIPECKGMTLEEVNLLFYHKVPAWKSVGWKPPVSAMADLQDMTLHHGNIEGPKDMEMIGKMENEFVEDATKQDGDDRKERL